MRRDEAGREGAARGQRWHDARTRRALPPARARAPRAAKMSASAPVARATAGPRPPTPRGGWPRGGPRARAGAQRGPERRADGVRGVRRHADTHRAADRLVEPGRRAPRRGLGGAGLLALLAAEHLQVHGPRRPASASAAAPAPVGPRVGQRRGAGRQRPQRPEPGRGAVVLRSHPRRNASSGPATGRSGRGASTPSIRLHSRWQWASTGRAPGSRPEVLDGEIPVAAATRRPRPPGRCARRAPPRRRPARDRSHRKDPVGPPDAVPAGLSRPSRPPAAPGR